MRGHRCWGRKMASICKRRSLMCQQERTAVTVGGSSACTDADARWYVSCSSPKALLGFNAQSCRWGCNPVETINDSSRHCHLGPIGHPLATGCLRQPWLPTFTAVTGFASSFHVIPDVGKPARAARQFLRVDRPESASCSRLLRLVRCKKQGAQANVPGHCTSLVAFVPVQPYKHICTLSQRELHFHYACSLVSS